MMVGRGGREEWWMGSEGLWRGGEGERGDGGERGNGVGRGGKVVRSNGGVGEGGAMEMRRKWT